MNRERGTASSARVSEADAFGQRRSPDAGSLTVERSFNAQGNMANMPDSHFRHVRMCKLFVFVFDTSCVFSFPLVFFLLPRLKCHLWVSFPHVGCLTCLFKLTFVGLLFSWGFAFPCAIPSSLRALSRSKLKKKGKNSNKCYCRWLLLCNSARRKQIGNKSGECSIEAGRGSGCTWPCICCNQWNYHMYM